MLHAAQELLACLVLLGNALNPGTLLRVPLLKPLKAETFSVNSSPETSPLPTGAGTTLQKT